ncbi:MAG: SURF1 family cytochrome oxidase biogenesis protein, partial [Pseudomonadota bacterium]
MRRWFFALLFGFGGAAILVALSVWQVQRLEWKEGRIAAIEAQLAAEPRRLSEFAAPDRFAPVRAEGAFSGPTLDVLTSIKNVGPG